MLSLIPWKRSATPAEGNWMLPLDPVRSEMSQILSRFVDGLPGTGLLEDPIRLDVRETADEVIVRAEVPGIEPGDLDIQLVGDVLSLSGEKKLDQEGGEGRLSWSERRYGAFHRTIRLAAQVDADKVRAEHKNGVVTITLTKAESSRPRRIQIRAT